MGDFWQAYILQVAANNLGYPRTISPSLLGDLGLLIRGLEHKSTTTHGSHILKVAQGGYTEPEAKLSLLLDALRLEDANWEGMDRIDDAVRSANFHDQVLSQLVHSLLKAAAFGIDIRAVLRRRLASCTSQGERLSQVDALVLELKRRHEDSGTTFVRSLRTDHCRIAWRRWKSQWLDDSIPELDKPSPRQWDYAALRQHAVAALRASTEQFDAAGSRFEDRSKMDREANHMVTELLRLASLAESLARPSKGEDNHLLSSGVQLPSPSEFGQWAASTLSEPIEEFCRQILLALTNQVSPDPLVLTPRDLVRWPELVPHLGVEGQIDLARFHFDVRACADAIGASAVLVRPPSEWDPDRPVGEQIREQLVANERIDVLTHFLSDPSIGLAELSRIQRQVEESGAVRVHESFANLETVWHKCDQLACIEAADFRDQVADARRLADRAHDLLHHHALLLSSWMEMQAKAASVIFERDVVELRDFAAERGAEVTAKFDAACQAEQIWLLSAIANDHPPSNDPPGAPHRWTMWRTEATLRYDAPDGDLRQIGAASKGPISDFIQDWLVVNPVDDRQRSVRKTFAELAVGEMGPVRANRTRAKDTKRLVDATQWQRGLVGIDCATLLENLDSQGLNPLFIPQLAGMRTLVVISAPPLPTARRGNYAAQCAQLASEASGKLASHSEGAPSAGGANANCMVVMLSPRLPKPLRAEVVYEVRRRKLAVAVIDDIDLLRILEEDGSPSTDARRFLEVALEQLPLAHPSLSPFTSADGQFIRPELFAGRRDLAQRLALDGQYSRVYSGRKLGKSAFLKFVANRYDDYPMPTGERLQVVLTSMAGVESEPQVADRLIQILSRRFPVAEARGLTSESASDRLMNYLDGLVRANQKRSFLLLIDEADAFVEDQLRIYSRIREKCLSFRLMKQLPQRSGGVQPIRVVLCGYRMTNTRDGAWANAGGVLQLPPLEDDEAEALVAAPLAHLGIDLSSHAAYVAQRCGNQPAILQRFGESLLAEVKKRAGIEDRDHLIVTSDHVAAAFNDEAVTEEIRTVIFNNFQQNPSAHVIFTAALLAFSRLGPGFELRDPEVAIVEQIRLIDSNTDWLERRDPEMLGEIGRQLRDFEVRRLIRRDPITGSCRLRVSHSLQVLLSGDLIQQARKYVASARNLAGDDGGIPHRSLLTESQLEDLQTAYHETALCRAVVVTSLWDQPLMDRSAGLPDRLALDPRHLLQRDPLREDSPTKNASHPQAILAATTGDLEDIHVGSGSARFLVGGVDLARRLALHEINGEASNVEWIPLSRVSERGVGWWFEKIRSIRFPRAEGSVPLVKRLHASPLFLELADRILHRNVPNEGGLSPVELEATLSEAIGEIPELAEVLRVGPRHRRLETREIQVLKMVCAIAKAYENIALPNDFTSANWNDISPEEGSDWPPPDDGDKVHLLLLQKVGLVVPNENGVFLYERADPDPVFLLAEHL